MSRAFSVLLALLVLALAAAPAALAQSNPFGPLPPPAPEPTPVPTIEAPDDGKFEQSTLLFVGAGVILVFGGLGYMITRDARRSLTEDDRAALERGADKIPHRKGRDAKARARAKTKAQKQARRKARRKSR